MGGIFDNRMERKERKKCRSIGFLLCIAIGHDMFVLLKRLTGMGSQNI